MDGVEPNFENIVAGKYEISRTLYVYVKNQHVGKVPGIAEYVAEFLSDKAAGEEGYLADKGLIPFSAEKLKEVRGPALKLTPMM